LKGTTVKTLTALDARYSVAREFNGSRPYRVWVVRFCGDYLGWAPAQADARNMARSHRRKFLARIASI